MKVGTVSKVMLGGNADVSTKSGIIIDADVILGKAEGRTKDLKGLVLSNKVMFGKSVSRAVLATVSGVPPLVLPNAVGGNVVSLKAFGGTERRPLVPTGYTEIDYLEVTSSGPCIDTGVIPNSSTKIEIVFKSENITSTQALAGSRTSTSGDRKAFIIWENVGSKPRYDYGSDTKPGDSIDTVGWNTIIKDGIANTLNGVSSQSNIEETFTGDYPISLFGVNTAGTYGNKATGAIKSVKIWQNGTVLSCNLIPCYNSSNVLGLYDTVTNTFLTNVGTGDFSAGPITPIDIITNNGAFKYSPNLLNPDNIEVGYYRVSGTGVLTPSPYNWAYMGYMPVTPGTKYIFYGRRRSDNHLSAYNRIHWYNADKEFISTNSYTINTIGTGTAPSNAAYACVSCNESGGTTVTTTDAVVAAYDWVFEAGTSEAPYIPYSATNPYTTGPIETIGIKDSNNLLPADAQPDVLYPVTVTAAGNFTASANVNNGQNLAACEIRYYNESMQQINYYTINGYSDGRMYKTFSVTTAVKYMSITRKVAYATTPVTELKVETGNTMTPYFNGGTATTEMLLSLVQSATTVYTDEQEVISGAVTRKVGVKIFNGQEDWTLASNADASGNRVFYIAITDKMTGNNKPMLCTHYAYVGSASYSTLTTGSFLSNASNTDVYFDGGSITTQAAWQQWIAAQYAAGTPVIVTYPLATETTETVTGQPMSVQQGTNIVEITQAALDDLELEVSYYAGAEVTITEIENAQLSSDVEVTIS